MSAYLAGPTQFGTFTIGSGYAVGNWSIWLQQSRPVFFAALNMLAMPA